MLDNDQSQPASGAHREAAVRWQATAREQRSAVNSLFLTYASALIGIGAAFLMDDATKTVAHATPFALSLAAAIVSVAIGCVVVLNRLTDTRTTAQIARLRANNPCDPQISDLQEQTAALGERTITLMAWQVALFATSACFFVLWIAGAFGSKLNWGW